MRPEREEVRELLGAYVLGHLDTSDAARVEAALEHDPRLRAEVAELRAMGPLLDLVGPDDLGDIDELPPELAALLVQEGPHGPDPSGDAAGSGDVGPTAGSGPDRGGDADAGTAGPSEPASPAGADRRARTADRRWAPLAVAASLVAVAVTGVVLVRDGDPPPGLGVEEPIEVAVAEPDVAIDASLVPHTWGTEVFLTMTGLEDGRVYTVELETADGTRVSAGTFLGDADLEVVCVMNGALLREDVAAVVIEAEPGDELMRAELDPVDYRSV